MKDRRSTRIELVHSPKYSWFDETVDPCQAQLLNFVGVFIHVWNRLFLVPHLNVMQVVVERSPLII